MSSAALSSHVGSVSARPAGDGAAALAKFGVKGETPPCAGQCRDVTPGGRRSLDALVGEVWQVAARQPTTGRPAAMASP
jgi:hypothetical protein